MTLCSPLCLRTAALIAAALSVAACASTPAPTDTVAPMSWRAAATETDRDRIRTLRRAWADALADAQAAGQGDRITAAGVLLDPDAAQPGSAPPPPGRYRCAVRKIGAQQPGVLSYVEYPTFACRIRVEADGLHFAKLTGSQRQVGRLYPDEDRSVFLGSMVLGDETRSLGYGRDTERDLAGVLERIGPERWRLVFPYPHWESLLDVMEITPMGENG